MYGVDLDTLYERTECSLVHALAIRIEELNFLSGYKRLPNLWGPNDL